jgi:hypothetical protein
MRISGGLRRLRSAEECVALVRMNSAAAVVAAICFGISGVILALAWRVLSG